MIISNFQIYISPSDFRLHIFDTAAPPQPITPQRRHYDTDDGMRTTLKVSRTIQGRAGRWTITDANLSPDNERFAISAPLTFQILTSITG